MGIKEIFGALTSTSKAIGAAIEARDMLKLSTLRLDFNQQLIELSVKMIEQNQTITTLAAEKEMLRKEVQALSEKIEKIECYVPCTLASGIVVYRLKNPEMGTLNNHYICPLCFENDLKAITLQPYGASYLRCPKCGTKYGNIPLNLKRQTFAVTD